MADPGGSSTRDARQSDWLSVVRARRRDLAIDPSDIEAREELFQSLVELGRRDDALLEGRRLIDEGAASLSVLLDMAKLLIQSSRPTKAISLLRDRWREDPAAGAILAWAYDAAGNQGIAEFMRSQVAGSGAVGSSGAGRVYFARQLAELIGRYKDSGTAFSRGLIEALEDGRFAEAGPHFFQWLESGPPQSLTVLARADWAMLTGNMKEAKTLLQRYPVEERFAGEVENRLGDIARLRGNLSKAKGHWKRAIILTPNDWNAWLDLIRAEAVSGNLEVVRRLCKRVMRLDPPDHIRLAVRATENLGPSDDVQAPGISALGWTEKGGGVVTIECAVSNSQDGLLLTGHTGRVLEESARVAFQYLRREEGCFQEDGVHLHFPDMRALVDGSSAGLALVTLLWAKACGEAVGLRVGLTGQIGLDGRVYPVDGMREKLIAAHLAELDLCVIPAQNTGDIAWLPRSVRRELRILTVSSFPEVKEIF